MTPATGTSDAASLVTALFFITLMVALWFLPVIIAALRHKSNTAGIAVITVLLGWTVVGWVIALVMSCNVERAETAVYINGRQS